MNKKKIMQKCNSGDRVAAPTILCLFDGRAVVLSYTRDGVWDAFEIERASNVVSHVPNEVMLQIGMRRMKIGPWHEIFLNCDLVFLCSLLDENSIGG